MTDEELMIAYQNGDIEAFRSLYQRHEERVMGYLVKRLNSVDEAEEVFQDLFVKLHEKKHKYREDTPFLPWFFVVIRNTMIDYIRRVKRKEGRLLFAEELVNRASNEGEKKWDINEAVSEMSGLSDVQQRALLLRFKEGFEFDEIAADLETSAENARQIISRGVRKLKKIIAGENKK